MAVSCYESSLEHLLARLEQIDLKIRSQVARFRSVQREDEQFRGLYVSEQQVDALLAAPLAMPAWLLDPSPNAEHHTAIARGIAEHESATIEAGTELRLARLATMFSLAPLDIDILLVCLAAELDTRYEKLYAYLQDDVTRTRPSIDLVLALLIPDPLQRIVAREHFLADAPLRCSRIIEVFEDASRPSPPFIGKLLRIDERIVSYLLGSNAPDARIAPYLRSEAPRHGLDELVLPASTLHGLKALAHQKTHDVAIAVHLQGPAGAGKLTVARAVCRERGAPFLCVDASLLLADADVNLNTQFALIAREARLADAVLYIDAFDALLAHEQHAALRACLAAVEAVALSFLAGEASWLPGSALHRARFFAVVLARPDIPEREHLWRKTAHAHGAAPETLDLEGVATKFRFTPGQIDDSWRSAMSLATWRAKDAKGTDHGSGSITSQDLYDACRLNSNRALAALAQKITPRFTWKDIVLPADRIVQLREICNHVKYHNRVFNEWGFEQKLASSKGLTFLFAGPSGTGKTMAAGIIANELGLDLYKIDLSLVISKFIGETEKNLARIFDEAETANAILFFDEADSLFGKRSDVKDSHDRYANIEVGYLLQRIEEYQGVAILASNFRRNMDEAFVRRLQFTVDFPLPTESDRQRMWMAILPEHTPRDRDLDLALIARRYNLSGGNIRNVALAAAFLAADDGDMIRMSHLISATQREYQKMGKLVGDGAFTHALT
ncbi:ATP-binding protein [Paraburkholderia sp. 31.1]|uniref:ATP-binding protein n=1 Tax=Paraburkholderia sp. 31.1 TaxID=2615205 RepID=UPI0016553759|nr:ATP-binding protein [Paraburkholderia sp. 31.1]MBC8724319.1 ATP-binding protein [Paraburkholderia sp. 31.1]